MLGIPIDFKHPTTLKALSIRSFLTAIHGFFYAFAQFIIPLPVVYTIGCSGTLFIFVIDYLLNDIKVNSKQVLGICIGIIGAILATNGRMITKFIDPSYQYNSKFQNYITDDPFIISIFSFIFLIVIILWGFGIVICKKAIANTFQVNYIIGLGLLFCGGLVYPFV